MERRPDKLCDFNSCRKLQSSALSSYNEQVDIRASMDRALEQSAADINEPTTMEQQQKLSSIQFFSDDERVPIFLIKLWNIVADPNYQRTVRWDESGYSFHIIDPVMFSRHVLPQYFKHNNLSSLIRQLNMYGFRKITPIETGVVRPESDQEQLEFSHPYFVKNHPELLNNIKRKSPNVKSNDSNAVSLPNKDLKLLVDEIRQLREKQRVMEAKMTNLVKENESVWQQISHIRNMHIKQQHVVNKIVQFLVGLVHHAQKRIGKRRLLAIDEISGKRPRIEDSTTAQTNQPSNLAEIIDRLQRDVFEGENDSVFNTLFSPKKSQGLIIADVTDELEEGGAATSSCPNNKVASSDASFASCTSVPQGISDKDAKIFSPTICLSPSLDRQISEELAEYLNGQEQGIDTCRDLLGSCWELIANENDDEEPIAFQQQPLMLGGSDPLLALSEAPPTPDLLTPSTSPPAHDDDCEDYNKS